MMGMNDPVMSELVIWTVAGVPFLNDGAPIYFIHP
jgi:hypothetical protein